MIIFRTIIDMGKSNLSSLTIAVSALCMLSAFSARAEDPSAGKLKGRVETGVSPASNAPAGSNFGLGRHDVGRGVGTGSDPFSGAGTFSNAGGAPPAGKKSLLPGYAGSAANADFFDGYVAPKEPLAKVNAGRSNAPESFDNSKSMQIAWDAWHKRLAAVVYDRFERLAQLEYQDSPPLMTKVSYSVTSQGQIKDFHIVQASGDNNFDRMIQSVIFSVNGDNDLLLFPSGSKREIVSKTATFVQNYGDQGYRSAVGDKENSK